MWAKYRDYKLEEKSAWCLQNISFPKLNFCCCHLGKQDENSFIAGYKTQNTWLNNDNTKSTTSKIIAETKIIGSTKCIGKKWSLNQTWWSSYYKNLTIKMNLVTSRGHSYKNNELWNELKHQMRRGKAHNAVKIMVDNIKNDILLNEETFQQLNRKHPPRRSPDPEVLLP